jgi:hypothetical protein
MSLMATIKNWADFQHYRDRSPPWLKLHRKLLDDRAFQSLPIASKALAPMLWLRAAENMEGRVDIETDELVFRLRWGAKDIEAGITPLIEKGFLIVDSEVLAACKQGATPETEGERAGRDKGKSFVQQAARFDEFWKEFPSRPGTSKSNKKGALAKWKARHLDEHADAILADVRLRKVRDKQWLDGYCPDPTTYINQDRWTDGFSPPAATTGAAHHGPSPAKQETGAERIAAAEAWAANMRNLGHASEEEIQEQVDRIKARWGGAGCSTN